MSNKSLPVVVFLTVILAQHETLDLMEQIFNHKFHTTIGMRHHTRIFHHGAMEMFKWVPKWVQATINPIPDESLTRLNGSWLMG